MTNVDLRKAGGNVPGRFYTTACCIACGSCEVLAPGLFRGFPSGRYVVIRPSRDEKERAAVLVAYQIIFEPNAPGPCIVDTLDPENTPDELKDRSAKGGVEL